MEAAYACCIAAKNLLVMHRKQAAGRIMENTDSGYGANTIIKVELFPGWPPVL